MAPSKKRKADAGKLLAAHAAEGSRPERSAEPPAEPAVEPAVEPAATRGRPKKVIETTASSTRPSRTALASSSRPPSTRSSGGFTPINEVKKSPGPSKDSVDDGNSSNAKTKATAKPRANSSKKAKAAKKAASPADEEEEGKGVSTTESKGHRKAKVSVEVSAKKSKNVEQASDDEADGDYDGPAYWLMKAEPESRIEKGKDVKFSIDDLKAATAPEAWDGE